MSNNKENNPNELNVEQDILLSFVCPICKKIRISYGTMLSNNINYLSDYGNNYTGETIIRLFCAICDDWFELKL